MSANFASRHRLPVTVASGILVLGLAILLFLFSGNKSGTVDMAGKVISRGKTVVFGTVTAIDSQGNIHSAPIRPDGSYEFKGLPPGPLKIAVTSPNPRPVLGASNSPSSAATKTSAATRAPPDPLKVDPRDRTRRKAMAAESETAPPPPVAGPDNLPQQGNWFPINGRYADPNTSGIRMNAGSGNNEIRVD